MYAHYYNNLIIWHMLILPINSVHYYYYYYYYLLTPTTTASIAYNIGTVI